MTVPAPALQPAPAVETAGRTLSDRAPARSEDLPQHYSEADSGRSPPRGDTGRWPRTASSCSTAPKSSRLAWSPAPTRSRDLLGCGPATSADAATLRWPLSAGPPQHLLTLHWDQAGP